jgi:hypothetical protein
MTTHRGVTEQAAIAAIESGTRVLRLPTIRDRFEEIAAAAQREQLSYLGFLAELVMAEWDDQDRRWTCNSATTQATSSRIQRGSRAGSKHAAHPCDGDHKFLRMSVPHVGPGPSRCLRIPPDAVGPRPLLVGTRQLKAHHRRP